MIAIPVDSATPGVKSSKLFGNAELFAIYRPVDKVFSFVRNPAAGNGVQTAKQLKEWDVKSVVYSYMGNGPFNTLSEEGLDVYYIGKEPVPLLNIIDGLSDDNFVKVDQSNADTYLDPGTQSGSCGCGCSHD